MLHSFDINLLTAILRTRLVSFRDTSMCCGTDWFLLWKIFHLLKLWSQCSVGLFGSFVSCGVPHWRLGIDYYSVFTCMLPAKGEMAAVCFSFTSAHHDELWQLTSEQPVKESACNEQPACLRDACHHISNKVILHLSLFLSHFLSRDHSQMHFFHAFRLRLDASE